MTVSILETDYSKAVSGMSETPIVFIVDDDPAVQRAVAIVARSLSYAVRTLSSAEDFLYAFQESDAGCLVLDVRMPTMTGLELQKMLKSAGVTLPVIMISGHADVRMAVEAMSSGAFTFLEKPFRMNELTEKINQAVEKNRAERQRDREFTDLQTRMASLTRREREVLDLLLQGKTNKEMAEQLGLSLRAIEDRRARLMKRMGAASTVELVSLVRSLP